MQYRAELRKFDLERLAQIINQSTERYYDTETGRAIVIGHHDNKRLVMVPYETYEDTITPVTVHVTTRQQINFRLRTGRFIHE